MIKRLLESLDDDTELYLWKISRTFRIKNQYRV